jgi:hypothetical protein
MNADNSTPRGPIDRTAVTASRVDSLMDSGVSQAMTPSGTTVDNLNDVMEFEHVIQVHPDGTITDAQSVDAPDLYDGELHYRPDRPPWTLMKGYSGQHGYAGPLMHQSEYIGGGLARDILAQPGYYVAVINRNSDDEEPTEWAVARADVPDQQH